MPLQRPTTDSCWKHAIAAGRTMFFLGKWWDSAPIYGEMGIKDWIWGLQNSISYNNWGKTCIWTKHNEDMIWYDEVWYEYDSWPTIYGQFLQIGRPIRHQHRFVLGKPMVLGVPKSRKQPNRQKMTDWEDWAEKMTSSSGKFPKTVTIS